MTAEEWKERAAKRYQEWVGVTAEQAKGFSEATWQTWIDDGAPEDETPEDMVDSDLSYWTD